MIFALLLLDFWPLNRLARIQQLPLQGGVSRCVLVLLLAALLYLCGVWAGALEPVVFMVWVAIGLLFGALVPLLMFEGRLFSTWGQPRQGFGQLLLAVIVGPLLALLLWQMTPLVSGVLPAGAPGYDHELWLASTLLAVTFPLMVAHSQFFAFWPLPRP